MTPASDCAMGRLERVLSRIETRPWWGLYRLAIGFCVVPAFVRYRGVDGSDWRLVPFFVFVLLTLRLVPVAVRRVCPFSEALKARWSRQRLLGKRFDSYQWRKLLWFGLGVTAHAAVFYDGVGVPEIVVAVACLVFGGLGALAWWRHVRTKADLDDLIAERPPRIE